MMTPQEVSKCTFPKAPVRGYNMASVDDFLDKLTEDYTELYKENAALKSKLKVLADKMDEYRQVEDAMRSTLLAAQKMATNMVSEAESQRDAMIAEASVASQKRLEELNQEIAAQEQRLADTKAQVDAQLQQEQRRLAAGQQELRSFIASVRTVCNDQLAALDRLPELPEEEPVQQVAEQTVPAEKAEELDSDAAVAAEVGATVEESLQSMQSILSAFQQQEKTLERAEEPVDPFQEEPRRETPEPTRIMNLDDLQFGRNYNHE